MLANRQVGSAAYPVFNKDLARLKGREAWNNNLQLAALVASKLGSCLGPTGAYKLVTYHKGPELVTKVTKDAVDIVDELAFSFSEDLEDALLQIIDSGRGLLSKRLREELAGAIHLVKDQDGVDIARIRIETKLGGGIDESRLVRGIVIKKEKKHRSMPDLVERPRIALVYKKLELKPPEQLAIDEGPFPTRLHVTEVGQLHQYIAEERSLRYRMVEKVRETGANVLFCGHKIDERVADGLSRAGIFALEMFAKHDFDEISRVTRANIAGTVDLLAKDDIGTAKALEVDKIPPEKIAILHCDSAATILLRGASP